MGIPMLADWGQVRYADGVCRTLSNRDQPMSTIVYILGTSFCGSTLLHTLLDRHPDVNGFNELIQLGRYFGEWKDMHHNPLDRPFWQSVRACYERETGKPFDQIDLLKAFDVASLKQEQKANWKQTNEALYDCLFRKTGKSIIVDSSKHATRLAMLLQSDYADSLKVIYLVRDQRAVYASFRKRGNKRLYALRGLHSHAIRSERVLRKLPDHQKFHLRYESLVADPEGVLRNLTDFIGVPYTDTMLAPDAERDKETIFALGLKGQKMVADASRSMISPERAKNSDTLSPVDHIFFHVLGGGLLNLYYGGHEKR